MARVVDFLTAQVDRAPDNMAVSDSSGAAWTYADLDRASDDLASELTAAGVVATDRVLLLVENCAAAVATLHAGWKIGAVVIPFNARQTDGEVDKAVSYTHLTLPTTPYV